MIHCYKNNGYNIVLDVNSGSVHVVDDVTYDVISMYENNTEEEIDYTLEKLKKTVAGHRKTMTIAHRMGR